MILFTSLPEFWFLVTSCVALIFASEPFHLIYYVICSWGAKFDQIITLLFLKTYWRVKTAAEILSFAENEPQSPVNKT
jgi:hypothetical protein